MHRPASSIRPGEPCFGWGSLLLVCILGGLCWLCLTWPATCAAQEAAAPPTPSSHTLLVGVTEAAPFAFKDATGEWTGIAVELWRDIMAHRQQPFTLQEMDLHALLQALEQGSIDAAVTALSITSSREQHMDFSTPYFDTDLAIAVPRQASSGVFLNVLEEIFSLDFLVYVGMMLLCALVAGCLVWLLERRVNPEQFRHGAAGVFDGIWWASVTMTTVGYGDAAPKSLPARMVALFWMFSCVILVTVFTASITTTLTVNRIGSRVNSVADLAAVHAGCLADSMGEELLQHLRVQPHRYQTLEAALADLQSGMLDALVHDRPLLQYALLRGWAKQVVILPTVVENDNYGFAFPAHSPLRKRVNVELLRLRANRTYWENLTAKFLGT
ncbi:transporter substrate-binding domain-containing protein [Megalodesulfovibrio gigas]|uniref:Putative extracellular solute-binding protein n=1 Tax=Megalodesulfovibrio gigas (strain ATCC 19364 / DSM 1382 / NCIMB 9332 / VKM B-1759) TaxID=1121448 RepID=T2GDP9_MEGG1|nr:transporter substrate-binding domain-containing protein [Megalodesulfovibrio gigas]AGW14700.1 putative extracellular solute-binding protein [Megalodesulfovibrio gigas DSM 1382 = ATCC 19364]